MSNFLPSRRLLVWGVLLLMAATPASAQEPAPEAPPTTGSSETTVPAPSGPKQLEFETTLPEITDPDAKVSFTITDDNDQPAATVILKPSATSPGTWDVFVAFGDSEPVSAGVGVAAGQPMSFKIVVTNEKVALVYGGANEAGYDGIKEAPLPRGFNLAATSMTVKVAWSFPRGSNNGAGAAPGDSISIDIVSTDVASNDSSNQDNSASDADMKNFSQEGYVSR